MANIQVSGIVNGSTIAFDPDNDVLVFDDPAAAAARVAVSYQNDLSGVGFDLGSFAFSLPADVKLDTVVTLFDDGSRLVVGSLLDNDSLTGTEHGDQLIGLSGNDSLAGGAGKDRLDGGAGNDRLDGGGGADSLTGGAGNDHYIVQNSGDKTNESSNGGTADRVSAKLDWTLAAGIEQLVLTGSQAIDGSGNALANRITGNAADNRLAGGDGKDTLIGGGGIDTLVGGKGKDQLDGGSQADSMTGGGGNDTYVVQNSGDLTIEASGGGSADRVQASINWTLAGEIERLTLNGSSDIKGHGNGLDNTIIGNSGDNLLRGSTGNDTLTGGAGDDVFRFSSALNGSTNVDTLLDFKGADDTIELENNVFLALTSTGVLKAANFRASTSGNAGDGNDFVLFETDTGQLFYDADGNGAGAKVLIATLTDAPTLAASDIFVT